jgi:hypothetical protein
MNPSLRTCRSRPTHLDIDSDAEHPVGAPSAPDPSIDERDRLVAAVSRTREHEGGLVIASDRALGLQ